VIEYLARRSLFFGEAASMRTKEEERWLATMAYWSSGKAHFAQDVEENEIRRSFVGEDFIRAASLTGEETRWPVERGRKSWGTSRTLQASPCQFGSQLQTKLTHEP